MKTQIDIGSIWKYNAYSALLFPHENEDIFIVNDIVQKTGSTLIRVFNISKNMNDYYFNATFIEFFEKI